MTQIKIHQMLTDVFRDVLDQPSLEIAETTTAPQVKGWDSLAHINLIVAVENAFVVTFSTKDVKALANVGDFIRLIERRLT